MDTKFLSENLKDQLHDLDTDGEKNIRMERKKWAEFI